MARYSKGEMSRAEILMKARRLLNEGGLSLGMDHIAREMGLSRGRITHFFPTKDSLPVGIMRDYEFALGEMLLDFNWNKGSLFEQLFAVLGLILSLQYEYRCAHSYLYSVGKNRPEHLQHVEASYFNRVDGIRVRIKTMVESGLVEPRLLEKPQLDIFIFQYTNILTTWMTSQEMYHRKTPFRKMKAVYLRGAMQLFLPYLTDAGKEVYHLAAGAYPHGPASSSPREK